MEEMMQKIFPEIYEKETSQHQKQSEFNNNNIDDTGNNNNYNNN